MSHMHWLSPCGKVICADWPLGRTSRPRMSGPQLFSFDAETLSVTTVWPVLLSTVKFCRAAPWTSALGVPSPWAGAAALLAGAAGAAGAAGPAGGAPLAGG